MCKNLASGGSKTSPKKQTSGSTGNSTAGGDRDGDDLSEGSGEEFGGGDFEEGHTGGKVRETERRYANNARERLVALIIMMSVSIQTYLV